MKRAKLILEDGTIFTGDSFGAEKASAGEVVFATGMTGYDLSLTDPSYRGQILTFTYPLIGNWGVPNKNFWESGKIQVSGVVVQDLCTSPNHWQSQQTLSDWLKKNNICGITNIDTRALTQKLREKGVMLGKIVTTNNDIDFVDPNERNLVSEVSIKTPKIHKTQSNLKGPTIAVLNCGGKRNIINCLTKRGATVFEVPWNFDIFKNNSQIKVDGLLVTNGPGDPKKAQESIHIIRKALERQIPTFGICLGNQLLALAAGGNTYKLKFGHRAQNQPTIQEATKRCYITTQNHGFAVDEKKLPKGFESWFINANDNTNEGIIHKKLPFFSVQFHPESFPGPTDTEWLFDYFLKRIKFG